MNTIILILLAVASAFSFYKSFIDKPDQIEKLKSWRIGLFITAVLFLAGFLKLFSNNNGDEVDSMSCKIDSLKVLIIEQSRQLGEQKVSEDSLKEFAECVQANQVLYTALDSGIVAIGLGDYRRAISHFNYAVLAAQNDSDKAAAYFVKSIAYFQWADFHKDRYQSDSARKDYKIILELIDSSLSYLPNNSELWMMRGNALAALRDYLDAIDNYDSSIVYDRTNSWAWNNKGFVQTQISRYREAVASHDSSLFYNHKIPWFWYNRGIALAGMAEFRASIQSYDSTIYYEHEFAPAWNNKAFSLMKMEQYDEASKCLDSAIKFYHKFPDAWKNKCVLLLYYKKYDEAIKCCDSAIKYTRTDTSIISLKKLVITRREKTNSLRK